MHVLKSERANPQAPHHQDRRVSNADFIRSEVDHSCVWPSWTRWQGVGKYHTRIVMTTQHSSWLYFVVFVKCSFGRTYLTYQLGPRTACKCLRTLDAHSHRRGWPLKHCMMHAYIHQTCPESAPFSSSCKLPSYCCGVVVALCDFGPIQKFPRRPTCLMDSSYALHLNTCSTNIGFFTFAGTER